MKTLRVAFLASGVLCALIPGQAGLNPPPFPPQDWAITVEFGLSVESALKIFNVSPIDRSYLHSPSFFIHMDDDSIISGPSLQAVLPTDIGFGGHDLGFSEPFGYVPAVDQEAIYSNACRVIESLKFTNTPIHAGYEPDWFSISIKLEVNDRSIAASFDSLHTKDDIPAELVTLLAHLRRNLPGSYDKVFVLMGIPKLPALSGEEAIHYLRCQVHGEWMKVDDVPIAYGLIIDEKSFANAKVKFFPNARTSYRGGCTISGNDPQEQRLLYCASCRKAQSEWQQKHDQEARADGPGGDGVLPKDPPARPQ